MDCKKVWAVIFIPLFAVSSLGAQSLAELSKKEKERRAAIKGKTHVITNNDLSKLKKKAAVIITREEIPAGEPRDAGGAERPASLPASGAPRPFTVQTAESGKAPLSDSEREQTKEGLKEKWAQAQEMVDLLTMKMNALWQKFYNMDDMTTRDAVQIEISDTYRKLLKAQEDEVKAKEALETFLSNTRRD